jgi:thioredoxin-like negative regulator of GroEL
MIYSLQVLLEKAQIFTYSSFISYSSSLFAQGKSTSNSDNEMYVYYTGLNLKRMSRWDKTFEGNEQSQQLLDSITEKQIWLVITEAWCGDSAQILPIIAKIASQSKGKIDLQIVLRDSNLELMDMFLTEGGRSVPKLIVLNPESKEVITTWGPRPSEAHKFVMEWKANPNGRTFEQMEQELHLWYARDKAVSIVKELSEALIG